MHLIRMITRGLLLILLILFTVIMAVVIRREPLDGERLPDQKYIALPLRLLWKILNLEVELSGPVPSPPALLVANHVSWLDIAVLGGITGTGFLAKHEIKHWPLVGWLARLSGTVFIHRGRGEASQVADAIAQRLRNGRELTIFPEGTTSDGTRVRPFFPRLFSAAIETGTAVVPVALRYEMDGELDRIAPYFDRQHILDNLRHLLGRKGGKVQVHFCTPLPDTEKDRRAWSEEAREAIIAALPHINNAKD